MKKLFTLLSMFLLIGGGNLMAMETYDFQELCMKLGKGGPWAVEDGGDAGFTLLRGEDPVVMHYMGDYTDQGFSWNSRFAYEFVDGRGKFTMRNKNNKKDSNCGMFSWDYAHYFSILGLKNGDKVTITVAAGTATFVSTNVEEDIASGDAVDKSKTYTISTTDETTHLDIQMAKATLISKITIEPYGVETVPTISLGKSTLNLIPGDTYKLSATVDPSDFASATQWKSSNEAVATVAADGTVTAMAAGKATITKFWKSGVSEAEASAACEVTVADVDLAQYVVARAYDFTAMGDITLEIEENAAGAIWNEANSKNNNVFYCTNSGLERIAVQAVVSSNKGWSIVDGQGLFLASGAGRCAAIGGLKSGQIVEVVYTGAGFYTRSDDDGVEKTALSEGSGRVLYQIDEDGMMGFELVKENAVKSIKVYAMAASLVQSATVGAEGWATLVAADDLDFTAVSGLEAYTAVLNGSSVTLTKVDQVKMGTAVVLKGTTGDYTIPYAATTPTTAKGDLTSGAVSDVENIKNTTYYGLAVKDGKACFSMVKSGSIAAGKAYFAINVDAGEAPELLTIAEGTTAIKMEQNGHAGGDIYTLDGMRMTKAAKGLYIQNGKKYIAK